MRRQLLLALAACALAAGPALAHQKAPASQNCPSMSRESRMQAIDDRIETLEGRLESLDSRLEDFDAQRREALDDAKTRIEAAAHDASLGRAALDAEVAKALASADAKARTATRSASSAHDEIRTVKGQIQALKTQLHVLAMGRPGSQGDPG